MEQPGRAASDRSSPVPADRPPLPATAAGNVAGKPAPRKPSSRAPQRCLRTGGLVGCRRLEQSQRSSRGVLGLSFGVIPSGVRCPRASFRSSSVRGPVQFQRWPSAASISQNSCLHQAPAAIPARARPRNHPGTTLTKTLPIPRPTQSQPQQSEADMGRLGRLQRLEGRYHAGRQAADRKAAARTGVR